MVVLPMIGFRGIGFPKIQIEEKMRNMRHVLTNQMFNPHSYFEVNKHEI